MQKTASGDVDKGRGTGAENRLQGEALDVQVLARGTRGRRRFGTMLSIIATGPQM